MKIGYKILWTDFALNELKHTLDYLEVNWTEKEIVSLVLKLEEVLSLIAQNPYLFQAVDFKNELRRVVILKHNTLYYRISNHQIEIISFFSNRQNPEKLNKT